MTTHCIMSMGIGHVATVCTEPEHDPQPTMVTYKRADGKPICGEYAFVTELEWFDMDDEQTELIEEGWMRVSVATVYAPERES